MNLTISEGMEFMNLLINNIEDLKQKYDSLSESITRCQLPKTDLFYKESGLTIEEMKDLQNSFKEQQHNKFILWYNLTQKLRANNEPHRDYNFKDVIIGEVRAWDVIDRYKREQTKQVA